MIYSGTDRLFAAYHRRLVAYAMKFVDGIMDAEDIVQNSYYSYLKKYDPCSQSEFKRLIFVIVRNNCLNFIKSRKLSEGNIVNLPTVEEESLYSYDFLAGEADAGCAFEELGREMEAVLDSLPDGCRKVFEMSRFRNMSNAEVAEYLGISVKTVKNQMTKALRAFKKKFK